MRGSATRAFVPALVVLALVGVVAVAATGSTSAGTDDSRPPSAWVIDSFLSLGMLLLIPAAAVFVYGLMQRQDIAREMARQRQRRTGIVVFLAIMIVFTAVSYYRLRNWSGTPIEDQIQDAFSNGEEPTPPPVSPDGSEVTYEPRFAWIPVLVVLGLVAIGAVAAILATRRRELGQGDEQAVARELADVLDDTLDDLRAETDPRRAVIAAYARLERVLAAHGLPRRSAETPEEYVSRILARLAVDRSSVRRLTELFAQAKFSDHVVDAVMKDEAIDSLAQVRDELRAPPEVAEPQPALPLRPDEGRV